MGSKGIVERMDLRPGNLYYREHLARYDLARKYVRPGPLLDIASGTGYGSDLLQPICQSIVIGIDIDLPALLSSRRAYPEPQITFISANGIEIPFQNDSFRTITCMETLEHIQDDKGFLRELNRVLRPDGTCIITTPNRMYSLNHGITNPYHIREYSEAELVELLLSIFPSVAIFYQGFGESYHANVRSYAETIQSRKDRLLPPLRWSIDHFYRPIKQAIPVSISNFFIHTLLGLNHPQPTLEEITISAQPVQDCSNFVMVCRKQFG